MRRPLGALAAAALLALVAVPAGAQTNGVAIDGEPCTDGLGVTVVVDFQELGDDTVVVRCAPDAPADGFAALAQADVPFRTTVAFPGFLCRLFDQPGDDPCDTASPATAYWSYWLAPAGGEWCYSNLGAGNRTPPPGSVEGWSFARDKGSEAVPPPRFDPPQPPAGSEPRPLTADDCTTSARSSAPSSGDDEAPSTTTAEPVGRGDRVDLDAASRDGAGSPVATIAGASGVAVVAATVFFAARRRRRPAPLEEPGPPDEHTWSAVASASPPAPAEDDGWSSVLARPDEAPDEMWAPERPEGT